MNLVAVEGDDALLDLLGDVPGIFEALLGELGITVKQRPHLVQHLPGDIVRVYDILGDEIREYHDKKYEDVQDEIEIAKGRLGVQHSRPVR